MFLKRWALPPVAPRIIPEGARRDWRLCPAPSSAAPPHEMSWYEETCLVWKPAVSRPGCMFCLWWLGSNRISRPAYTFSRRVSAHVASQ